MFTSQVALDLDWDWAVRNAKLLDRQNRLGFVTTMAHQLAKRVAQKTDGGTVAKPADAARVRKLGEYAAVLDRSRLVREDTLCHDSLGEAERSWLRKNRPAEAAHWNLLTDMQAQNLAYAGD